jgi:hypothetical protein
MGVDGADGLVEVDDVHGASLSALVGKSVGLPTSTH